MAFNRGALANAGFASFVMNNNRSSSNNNNNNNNINSNKDYYFDCIIIHDVDLLPENDANIYKCSKVLY